MSRPRPRPQKIGLKRSRDQDRGLEDYKTAGCSVDWSIPETLSEHSVLLIAGLRSLSLSPIALIPVLVLQCIDTDTDARLSVSVNTLELMTDIAFV